MNVFHKMTWETLKRNRTRTIVTVIGIILSAAMITAVSTFIASLQSYLLNGAIARNGDWHAAFLQLDSASAQQVSMDKEVADTALVQNVGYAALEGGQNSSKPYLFIAGFSPEAYETIPVKLLEGRMPQNSHEIVISKHIEVSGGVKYAVGDTLTLALGDRVMDGKALGQNTSYQKGEAGSETGAKADTGANNRAETQTEAEANLSESLQTQTVKTYQVVGICARPSFEPYDAPGYTVITNMTDQNNLSAGLAPSSFDLYVKLHSPAQVYHFTERYSGMGDFSYNREYLRYAGISNDDNFNAVLYSLGGILIVLIMTGSVLLIYNAFAISVSERKRQFGILSSVGATRKQLRKTVLFEGVCLGSIGIPLGLLAGVAGIGVTMAVVGGILIELSENGVSLALTISPMALTAAALVGLATILLSAYLPARKAAKLSAIDSIRQSTDIKVKAKTVKTSKLTERLFGLEGMLAGKNFKRDKKRYRSTIISLFVSIVLFISASAFGLYLKQGAERSVADFGYDLSYSVSGSALDDDNMTQLYNKLKSVGGVTDSAYMQVLPSVTELSKDVFSDRYLEQSGGQNDPATVLETGISLTFLDDHTYAQYLKELGLPVSDYTGANAKLVAVAKIQDYDQKSQRYVSYDIFQNQHPMSLQISPVVVPEDGSPAKAQNIDITFADKYPSKISNARYYGFTVYAPFSLKGQFDVELGNIYSDMIFLSDDPAKSAAEMKSVITEMNAPDQLFNVAEMVEQNRRVLLVMNIFIYGFIVLISLIAIANVFNTISTNINLRRREFAMLRSVGMTNRGFRKMMNLECVFYGVKALLYGLPTAAAITFLIYCSVLNGVDVPFTLPWASIGISVFSVFFVVFITMLYSIRKVNKENILDALRGNG